VQLGSCFLHTTGCQFIFDDKLLTIEIISYSTGQPVSQKVLNWKFLGITGAARHSRSPYYLLTRIKYRFVKIQDMDEILCRAVFLRSFNVLVCVDSINFFIV